MTIDEKAVKLDLGGIWEKVQAALSERGIELDCCDGEVRFAAGAEDSPKVRVVCVSPGVKDSVEEMARSPRDQVLMVRVDEATSRDLDAWVATGAVKSRSEAAALFIREGLKVREKELAQLREALEEVERAQERLKDRAREVFGDDG